MHLKMWPWSKIAKLESDCADMQRQIDRMRGCLDHSRLRELLLKQQLLAAGKNDARDARGRFTKKRWRP